MSNFIFKSQGLIKNIDNKLLIVQAELRHNRVDNQLILSKLSLIIHELDIRKQADEYYDQTSHQTELETHEHEDKEPD